MIGVVVVTHGQLATELVNAAEMIVGDLPKFTAVSIGWHDEVNDAREDIAQAIDRVRGDDGVLLLTDMMVAAKRPELFGPIVVAGSPLSYWAGVRGENPMRYTGGLLGGSWLTALMGDLGNGKFDGA